MKWLAKHDEMLRRLVGEKVHFSAIADEMSKEFRISLTRNSTIGRAGRLGLCSPKPPPKGPKAILESKPREAKPVKVPQRFSCDETGMRVADVVPLHLSLLDLEPAQCRWPYGGGPYTFCGCHAFDGGPYCEPHQALSVGRGTEAERRAA